MCHMSHITCRCWEFGFITCDNRVYEPDTKSTYGVVTDFVEPTDNQTDAYWQITVTVKRAPCSSLGMVYLPFMETFGEYLMGLKCNA